jgi:glutaredoxin
VLDRKVICPCERHERDVAEMGHCICHLFVDEDYLPEEIENPPERGEDSPWPEIVVYGAYWCRDTVRTFNLLNCAGVPYTIVDVDSDTEGADKVMGWNAGKLSTPTLDIEGRIVHVPSDEELAAILGLGNTPP